MRIYDISEPITPETAVFPGDTPFSSEPVMAMADGGAACNVSTIRMSVHCGSHADAPSHFRPGAADIASVDLAAYIGRCRLIDVRPLPSAAAAPVVDPACLPPELLEGAERVLLRTRPDHDHRVFDPGFVALGPAAATVLVAAGIRLVGIDSQSMDRPDSKELPAHNLLLDADIRLLENLDLAAVPPGDYELIALPLKIPGSDAAPVRAILRQLPPPPSSPDALPAR